VSTRFATAVLVSLCAASRSLAAEDPARAAFASATSAPASSAPGLGSLTQVSLSLALVLALVFGLAWLLRRVGGTRRPGAPGIDILAELALGPKERAVLLQVDRVRLLVGVGGGQVRTLHVLPEAEPVAALAEGAGAPVRGTAPSFADLLRKSLGR